MVMELKQGKNCHECSQSFWLCECKSCSKCGTPFMKYYGTSMIKGRSHCRLCLSAACVACIILLQGHEKVCTRCHIKQRELEIKTEKALLAICEEKFGQVQNNLSLINFLKTNKQKYEAIFDAVKKGQDCLVLTLINLGCDVNCLDFRKNTLLHFACEGGFLACVALLLEKGAAINAVNDTGWSALHVTALNATTDKHIDCVEFLLEMGADVLLENHAGETAADVARQFSRKIQVTQLLEAAEVEAAAAELDLKINHLKNDNPSVKERRLFRLIETIINCLKDHHIDDVKTNKVGSCCERRSSENYGSQTSRSSVEQNRNSLQDYNKESFQHVLNEKNEWETRARNLMQTLASTNKEHQKQIELLKKEIHRINEENAVSAAKIETLFADKIAKLRQESDSALLMLESQLANSCEAYNELSYLQKNIKLTWVPDELVKICQNAKCRSPFSKAIRKHHCRCCGRVFCGDCTKNKICLKPLGYTEPVRVCLSCFALTDDIFVIVDPV